MRKQQSITSSSGLGAHRLASDQCMESKFYRGGLVCQTTNKQAPWKQQRGIVRPHQPEPGCFEIGPASGRNRLPTTLPRRSLASVRVAVVVGQPGGRGRTPSGVNAPHGAKLITTPAPGGSESTQSFQVFSTSASAISSTPISCRHIRPGSVIVLPGSTAHFHWAKSSEYTSHTSFGDWAAWS